MSLIFILKFLKIDNYTCTSLFLTDLPPSSPPLDVKAEWMPSLRLLVISWSAPAGNDSSLLGYKLNWGLSSQYESLPKSARGAVPYTTQFFTIDNLVVKETYLISVWAYGLGGDGPSFNLKKFLPGIYMYMYCTRPNYPVHVFL